MEEKEKKWTFNVLKIDRELILNPEAYNTLHLTPLAETMAKIGNVVIDGPQDVDWGDRYGWTILSTTQLVLLLDAAKEALWPRVFENLRDHIKRNMPPDQPPTD